MQSEKTKKGGKMFDNTDYIIEQRLRRLETLAKENEKRVKSNEDILNAIRDGLEHLLSTIHDIDEDKK